MEEKQVDGSRRLGQSIRQQLDELIEVLMLHPGTARVVLPLIVFRYLILGVSSTFLIVLPLLKKLPDPFFEAMVALALTVLVVTLLLSWARRLRDPQSLKLVIVGAFCSDLAVEILALMTSGLSHSTLVVLPLLTLMSAAVFVGVRASMLCALFFAVGYPLGAYLVSSGLSPLHPSLQWTGLGQQVPKGQLLSFVLAQEIFFGLALVPFWALVHKLRALYRDFSQRLKEAIGRAEAEVHARGQERQALEQRLQQAQKLESLGLLAGGVAHDFNNVMVGIMGHAELMAMKLDAESEHHRPLSRIIEATRRAAGFCKQMLTYSGREMVHLAPVDLNALVQEIPHLLGSAIQPRATLELQLDLALPLIAADASQLSQVAMNLIINASEALGEQGGRVALRTGVFDPQAKAPTAPGWHQLSWQADEAAGLQAYLEVSDDGCGMDKETLDKILDPFFSTKFAGRGLGLSAVMGIVQGHRGTITITSRQGEGTQVRVAFPLSRQRHALRSPKPHLARGWRGSGKVLLVDDDREVIQVVKEMLATLGFEVLAAEEGERAIELLTRHAGQIRFVICDVAMPGMDGAAVLEAARALCPDIPFVLASGFSEADLRLRFADRHVERFLQKPFSYLQLQDVVYQLVHAEAAAPRPAPLPEETPAAQTGPAEAGPAQPDHRQTKS